MYIGFALFILLLLGFYLLFQLPVFGRFPTGARKEKILALSNYKNGAIQNFSFTPTWPEDISKFEIVKALIKRNPNLKPPAPLPFVKPELHSTEGTKLTWFGHSSYLLQINQLRVLVDPVFSRTTSPFSWIGNTSYQGTDFIHADDFDHLDIVLITHDHYDHFDMETILKLKSKVQYFVTSYGVGEHLERWGVPNSQIMELAWNEEATVCGLKFTAVPGRHFSGRTFKRNQTLWSAFILETPSLKLFLGGDSGYDTHFKTIGEQHGPFDLAVLECGQYHQYWPYIHMFPEQVVQAAGELKAKLLLPVHWAKFSLSLHDWDDPIIRVTKSAAEQHQPITTPMLGQQITLGEDYPSAPWWLNVKAAKQ